MTGLPDNPSESFKRRNPQLYPEHADPQFYEAHRSPSRAKPQSAVRPEPVETIEGKEAHPKRIHVRVISFRRRLLDPDNLCPKYFVDCLRYAGLIPNDRQQDITLEVGQVKVITHPEERTEIELS